MYRVEMSVAAFSLVVLLYDYFVTALNVAWFPLCIVFPSYRDSNGMLLVG